MSVPIAYKIDGTLTFALTVTPIVMAEPVRTSSGTLVVTSSNTTVTTE